MNNFFNFLDQSAKSEPVTGMRYLQISTQVLALFTITALIIAAGMEVVKIFEQLLNQNIDLAVQEGLFTLILLEMVFVVRSFVKYGSVNTGLIISVGIVAVVKKIILDLDKLDLWASLAFSIIFLSLSIGYLIENRHYELKLANNRKQRSLNKRGEENLGDILPSHQTKQANLLDMEKYYNLQTEGE